MRWTTVLRTSPEMAENMSIMAPHTQQMRKSMPIMSPATQLPNCPTALREGRIISFYYRWAVGQLACWTHYGQGLAPLGTQGACGSGRPWRGRLTPRPDGGRSRTPFFRKGFVRGRTWGSSQGRRAEATTDSSVLKSHVFN